MMMAKWESYMRNQFNTLTCIRIFKGISFRVKYE